MNNMATRRLYRSTRNAEILGVCSGIAEWRDLPVSSVRLVFIIIALCTAVFPCLAIYFLLGLILPANPYQDSSYQQGYSDGKNGRPNRAYYAKEGEDFEKGPFTTESEEDFKRRQKENDWDNRFSNS